MEQYSRDGLVFDVWDLGPSEGKLVILLHGYPQTKAAWSEVAPVLANAGYRVLAPDQRGYSPGARPRGRRQYRIDQLVGDVLALADEAGASAFHIVGHDWGGAVAWACAMWHPDRVLTVTSLATPHQQAFLRALLTSRQFFLSWYAMFFLLPWLPELSAKFSPTRRYFERALARSGLPEKHKAEYMAVLEQPGATTAALNWYRAGPLTPSWRYCSVGIPTLYVYAARDVALGRKAADLTRRYVTGPYHYEVLESANHWLPETEPGLVSDLLLSHFRQAY